MLEATMVRGRFDAAGDSRRSLAVAARPNRQRRTERDAEHAAHEHAGHDHRAWSGGWTRSRRLVVQRARRARGSLRPLRSEARGDFKAQGDWCKMHERPDSQCFVCHPEREAEFAAQYEAKYGKQPPKPAS